MRQINKQTEPDCMPDIRREVQRITQEAKRDIKSEDWDEVKGNQKQAIRESLVREQYGLCAYCMSRINPNINNSTSDKQMKVEHFLTRSKCPERMFDWGNLLGVCSGICHSPNGLIHHCDDSRGQESLHVHPATTSPPRPEEVFDYNIDGDKRGMLSATTCDDCGKSDCPYCSDLKVLNLNAENLVQNRKTTIQELRDQLKNLGKDETKIKKFLRKRYETATTPLNGKLPPYGPVAAKYLQKKLRQRGVEVS